MSSTPRASSAVIAISHPKIQESLQQALKEANLSAVFCQTQAELETEIQRSPFALVCLAELPEAGSILELAALVCQRYPFITAAILGEDSPTLQRQALRAGVTAFLRLPIQTAELQQFAGIAQRRADYALRWLQLETQRAAKPLQNQVDNLRTVERLGQSITAKLDLDQVLTAIVDAAVELTGAEEGSLLLLDHATGELYMRAARNFDTNFVQTFRLPIHDSLVSQVLHSGEPVIVDNSQPQKIKTAYLVHNLVYVPLKHNGAVLGILVVDNRTHQVAFRESDLRVLSALAEYAAIALENARLFAEMTAERNERDTILRGISDGVLVVDNDKRLVMVNEAARDALGLQNLSLTNRPIREVISQPELLSLLESSANPVSEHIEFNDEQGRAWNVISAVIPNVGMAVTLHDVTQFTKMERIKNDFVGTVSHDLRSPLTAIMGYVELIERAGPVNDIQRDFIRRVLGSVQNITNLINNLVSLGQIEAGFEAKYEPVQMKAIVEFALDTFQKSIENAGLTVDVSMDDLPPVYAHPVQMRQMVEHLLDNAVKYNRPGGSIHIRGIAQDAQLILQVEDSGIGIPPLELLFVFDKFYRASNLNGEVSGTGLGLAIVKSIVEKNRGRTWVESTPGQGSTFTVVLPVANI